MDWRDQLKNLASQLPEGTDITPEPQPEPEERQPRLDIGIERKGRGGKTATLITGWTLPDSRLLEIAATLKKRLGTGGSARGGDILIQGDRRNDCLRELQAMGYKCRVI